MQKCPLLLPVIHQLTPEISISEATWMLKEGADGVFLISHNTDNLALETPLKTLQDRFPEKMIGVNFLGYSLFRAIIKGGSWKASAIWSDDVGVHSSGVDLDVQAHFEEYQHDIEIFGSVAFKYQREEPNPPKAALMAAALGMIPTTSGSGTGSAPSIEKIQSMHEVLKTVHGDAWQLAIASGMDPDNIADFKPYLTHVLVATGISKDFHHADPVKFGRFLQALKS